MWIYKEADTVFLFIISHVLAEFIAGSGGGYGGVVHQPVAVGLLPGLVTSSPVTSHM